MRGDVVATADRVGDYTSKPRPALIIQSDLMSRLRSVLICPITSEAAPGQEDVRVALVPSDNLPLQKISWVQVDKITAVRASRIGPRIGRIGAAEIQQVESAILLMVGMA